MGGLLLTALAGVLCLVVLVVGLGLTETQTLQSWSTTTNTLLGVVGLLSAWLMSQRVPV